MPSVWERHARARIAAGDLLDPPVRHRFAWTRTDDGDPGTGLFGELAGRRVVDLGCGTGDNLAHLVRHHGAFGVGVDAAPSQIERARARWPYLDLHTGGAVGYLLGDPVPIEICYSVFGAVGLTPAMPLLVLIRQRLTAGGLLAFSVRAPHEGTRSPERGHPGVRWYLHAPPTWKRLLHRAGYTDVTIDMADMAQTPRTLIVTARRP
jgi:SAM-dependent methyltransferase